ncbi:MAG: hypothetical protein IT305_09225 [Chloroflexi bacterium]|nr:hypothetical protein [Chloroflexota bacterium]
MIPALVWLLVAQGLTIAAVPVTLRVCRGLPDRGFGVAQIVALVAVGWIAWLGGMLGFTGYVAPTVAMAALAIGVGGWLTWGRASLAILRERRALIIALEAVFLVTFAVGCVVRAYSPDILGQEKFMDYAFMNALLRTDSLPAEDMWLSGFAMPYYYFGYLLLGLPAKIAGTPGPIAYNLSSAFVFASSITASTSIVYALVHDRRRPAGALDGTALAFGLLGAALVMVAGNLDGPLEMLAAQGWGSDAFWHAAGVKNLTAQVSGGLLPSDGTWWWRASRVIPNIKPDGITEFPFFSFLLSDLHPHYMAIPFDLLIVVLALDRWLTEEPRFDVVTTAVVGCALATPVTASTWDVPTFWGLYALAALVDGWRRFGSGLIAPARLLQSGRPFLFAAVVVIPYFIGYQSQPLGLERVQERTPLASLLVLFGPALAIAGLLTLWLLAQGAPQGTCATLLGRGLVVIGLVVIALSVAGQPTLAVLVGLLIGLAGVGWVVFGPPGARRAALCTAPAPPFTWLLATLALLVLLGVEVIFIRDVFGTRMNTVFKFHYHAWLLLGLASGASLGLLWRDRDTLPGRDALPGRAWWRRIAASVTAVVLALGLVYPLAATWTRSGGFRGEPTLAGDRFLERNAPGDYRAIEWLRTNVQGRPVVVEAVGDDYSEYARVSTFSGLPTLLGWGGHELQWRGARPEYGERQQAVDAIYRAATSTEVMAAARKFGARYIFFGTLERAKYGAEAQARLDKMLPVAFTRGGASIYALPTDTGSEAVR